MFKLLNQFVPRDGCNLNRLSIGRYGKRSPLGSVGWCFFRPTPTPLVHRSCTGPMNTLIYIYINIYIYTFSFKKNGSWDSPLCESVTWNLLHWFVLYYSAAFPPAILWSKCCWSYLHDAVLSYHAVVATASENCSTGILQESRFGGVFFNF